MSQALLVRVLSFALVLVIGVAIGQLLHIRDLASAARTTEAEQADPRAPAREGAAAPTAGGPPGIEDARAADPLSETRYWISESLSDERPYGYAALIDLRPGGTLSIERCDAPDYDELSEVAAEVAPYLTPECGSIAQGRIRSIDPDAALVFADRDGREVRLGLRLVDGAAGERLVVALEGRSETMVPGQKNTIWEGLTHLPSVERAFAEKWEEHARLRAAAVDAQPAGGTR